MNELEIVETFTCDCGYTSRDQHAHAHTTSTRDEETR